eukprot:scaffold44607_cov18-Prasinocladus_malaysianus.AAC.2
MATVKSPHRRILHIFARRLSPRLAIALTSGTLQGFKLGDGQVHTPRSAMPLCGRRGQHSAAADPQADRLPGMHPSSKTEITSPTIIER